MNIDIDKKIGIIEISKKLLKLSPEIRKTTLTYIVYIFLTKICAMSVAYFVLIAITENQSNTLKFSLFFLMFKLLEWVFFVLQDRHSVKTRSAVINNLCKDVFSKVMNLSTNAVKGYNQ